MKRVKSNNKNNASYNNKYQNHIFCSFVHEVVCINNKLSKPVILYRGKNAVNKFIEPILQKHDYCKKIIKQRLNNNLVMSAEASRCIG